MLRSNVDSSTLEALPGRCGTNPNVDTETSLCGRAGFGALRSGVITLGSCALQCLACHDCRFATFSRRADDCSLYESCDVSHLAQGFGYETAFVGTRHYRPIQRARCKVLNLTTPIPGWLSRRTGLWHSAPISTSVRGRNFGHGILNDLRSSCVVRREYHSSAWERYWSAHVDQLMDSSVDWRCGCQQVLPAAPAMRSWLHFVNRSRMQHERWGCAIGRGRLRFPEFFSYHELIDTCTGVSLGRIPIEPLVGFLRNPAFELDFCRRGALHFKGIVDKEYLLPFRKCEVDLVVPEASRLGVRNLLFDLGASLYFSRRQRRLGGSSLSWLIEEYSRRGLVFDRVLAWEAAQHDPQDVFAMPAHLLDRVSYMNIPVDARPGYLHNPLRMLRSIARPHDFVVIKIDIDAVSIEESLVQQILGDESVAGLIDELYFEHHVYESPMVHKGWWESLKYSNHTLADSYRVFSKLRQRGIRAHSWV